MNACFAKERQTRELPIQCAPRVRTRAGDYAAYVYAPASEAVDHENPH